MMSVSWRESGLESILINELVVIDAYAGRGRRVRAG